MDGLRATERLGAVARARAARAARACVSVAETQPVLFLHGLCGGDESSEFNVAPERLLHGAALAWGFPVRDSSVVRGTGVEPRLGSGAVAAAQAHADPGFVVLGPRLLRA